MAVSVRSEKTAILLIAHGSRHGPANEDLFALANRFRERGEYAIVEPSFLELADPDIKTGGDQCVAKGATTVLMIPYFLSTGVHLIRDLTTACDQLRARHPHIEFRLGAALGPHPLLEDLVALRIEQIAFRASTDGIAASFDLAETYEMSNEPPPCVNGRLREVPATAIDTNSLSE